MNNKKYKEKECRKRRHKSPSHSDDYDITKEMKRHKHKKHHHKDRKRETRRDCESDGSDVVEVVSDQSPPTENSESSLSIDDTNKIRAKLGLKPLSVASALSKRDDGKKKDDWGEFYHKPAENWSDKQERDKLKEKLSLVKTKRQFESKLNKVKRLGEGDSDDDTELWIKKSRKIEQAKQEAEKRAKLLQELDEQFGVGEVIENDARQKRRQKYTEKNLIGLRVEHDVNDLAEERDIILTLKDGQVLGNEDDTLVNVNILDTERYKKNVENKKRKQIYNAYEDQEYDEFGNPKEKSLLSQYDEELNGTKKDYFKIGHDHFAEREKAIKEAIKEKLSTKKDLESLMDVQLKLASDYYNEDELSTKFKKTKKKVRKIRTKGKLTADALEEVVNNKGIEEIGSRRPKVKQDFDFNSIDDVPTMEYPTNIQLDDEKDDLLEKALHKARKLKQKEKLVADVIKETPIKDETEEIDDKKNEIDNGNIILNATAEFCRTLGDIPTYGKAGNRNEAAEPLIDEDEYEKEIKNDGISSEEDEEEETEKEIEKSGGKLIKSSGKDKKSGWNSIDPNAIQLTTINEQKLHHGQQQEVQILDEEPDVSQGMGAALKLAMSKGYLDKDKNNRPSNSRLAHLQAKHYSIEDKSYSDDMQDRNSNNQRRERYTGPITDFKEKDCFKPNVKLEYIDDDGHILNSKEAFRYLSHKFHGKGPGKNKIEKRLKKSVQEQLMKKMSSTDTPLGTLNMLQAKQKETQSPFVVLSGNKQTQSTIISKIRR